jgi:hypothetical protein
LYVMLGPSALPQSPDCCCGEPFQNQAVFITPRLPKG